MREKNTTVVTGEMPQIGMTQLQLSKFELCGMTQLQLSKFELCGMTQLQLSKFEFTSSGVTVISFRKVKMALTLLLK